MFRIEWALLKQLFHSCLVGYELKQPTHVVYGTIVYYTKYEHSLDSCITQIKRAFMVFTQIPEKKGKYTNLES